MPLDEANGGIGANNVTTTMVIETLAAADQGVAVTLMQNFKLIRMLEKAGTEEQKQRLFGKLVGDPRFLMAIGSSEPARASDFIIPFDAPSMRYQTKADHVDGGLATQWRQALHLQRSRRQSLFRFCAYQPGQECDGRQHLLSRRARHPRLLDQPRARRDGRAAND